MNSGDSAHQPELSEDGSVHAGAPQTPAPLNPQRQHLTSTPLGNPAAPKKPTSAPQTFTKASSNEQWSEAKQLLTPLGLITSIGKQLSGEATPQEEQQRHTEIQLDQQRMAQERRQLESYRESQRMKSHQQQHTNATLTDQANNFARTPILQAGASRSEQTLLEDIIQSGQEKQTHQQHSTTPQSTPKGPQATGGQPKTDMIAHMQPDKAKQKKSATAPIELPIGE